MKTNSLHSESFASGQNNFFAPPQETAAEGLGGGIVAFSQPPDPDTAPRLFTER
jgi:hypothetical protein